MPSPLGHALGGLIVGLATLPARPSSLTTRSTGTARGTSATPSTRGTSGTLGALATPSTLSIISLTACLPDVDFFWGRHNMETHSFVVALAVAAVIWVAARSPRLAVACGLAWASHVLFDWLGSDDSPPLGVMALWPLSSKFYFANAFIFEAISRRYREPGFWPQNIWAVTKEVLILAPPALALVWWRSRKRSYQLGVTSSKLW